MCYITIRSDKGFRAELRRSRSSYTGRGGGNAGYFVLPDVSKNTSRIPD